MGVRSVRADVFRTFERSDLPKSWVRGEASVEPTLITRVKTLVLVSEAGLKPQRSDRLRLRVRPQLGRTPPPGLSTAIPDGGANRDHQRG